jgi:hypothetical protein
MTVGVGAICNAGTDNPAVIVSSDRMVTTHQQSRIEHEHPETKLIRFAEDLPNTHLVGVIAGSIQLGERLHSRIEEYISKFVQNESEEPWVETAADLAGTAYRDVVQMGIEDRVLSTYGLELDDLSKQHQFQDSFLNDILAEANEMRQFTHSNLNLLFGGIGTNGPGLYQIVQNEVIPQNSLGYASIGSGVQPAASEFIKTEYGKSEDLESALATIAAAHNQAEKASGVGGEPDIIVADGDGLHPVDNSIRDELMQRQSKIADKQKEIKEEILSEESIQWSPS